MHLQPRGRQTLRLQNLLVVGMFLLCPSLLVAETDPTSFTPFEYEVPLNSSQAGNLYVTAQIVSVSSEFLVDTGASMVTIEKNLFDETPDGKLS